MDETQTPRKPETPAMAGWSKRFSPAPHGLARLRGKIEGAKNRYRLQTFALGAVTACLGLVLIVSTTRNSLPSLADLRLESLRGKELSVTGAHAQKVAGMPEGVRFYWLTQ